MNRNSTQLVTAWHTNTCRHLTSQVRLQRWRTLDEHSSTARPRLTSMHPGIASCDCRRLIWSPSFTSLSDVH